VLASLAALVIVHQAHAQVSPVLDPLRLTQPRQFEAFRASSNNPDLDSNDDSKEPVR
jgi:hypothetical protein